MRKQPKTFENFQKSTIKGRVKSFCIYVDSAGVTVDEKWLQRDVEEKKKKEKKEGQRE